MSKDPNPFFEKLLRFRILFLIILLFSLFLSVGIFFSLDTGDSNSTIHKEYFYKTWKVKRFYQNGKLVVNDKKFEDLLFKINKDSTAEWIRPDNVLEMRLWVSEDGSKLIKEDDESMKDIDIIYEIKENKLRFGKRTIESHYEYVLIPE
ncbi:hypothetical protein [uncultured Cytophaga sp.]|uniref:hypothetical protein n=1 Tax=uncultured Cytophaga sp. TaxID=160238 RepID=UPI0026273CDC|nr:hypothetical protein [uncultured Cytophaga sp.]